MPKSNDKPMDKRVQASRDKVLRETYRILSEQGFANASIDAISRHSGVAKTTIYRHWPSREDLLLDACTKLGTPVEPPDTGNLRRDLTILLCQLAYELKTAGWPAILPSIIDAAERDAGVAVMFTQLHTRTTSAYRTALLRAQERGEFSPSIKIADLLALTVGPLFYNRWYSREPLTDKYVERLLDLVMAGIQAT